MVKNMMYITSEIKPEVAGGSNRHSPQCKLGETMVEISFQKHEEKPHLWRNFGELDDDEKHTNKAK